MGCISSPSGGIGGGLEAALTRDLKDERDGVRGVPAAGDERAVESLGFDLAHRYHFQTSQTVQATSPTRSGIAPIVPPWGLTYGSGGRSLGGRLIRTPQRSVGGRVVQSTPRGDDPRARAGAFPP